MFVFYMKYSSVIPALVFFLSFNLMAIGPGDGFKDSSEASHTTAAPDFEAAPDEVPACAPKKPYKPATAVQHLSAENSAELNLMQTTQPLEEAVEYVPTATIFTLPDHVLEQIFDCVFADKGVKGLLGLRFVNRRFNNVIMQNQGLLRHAKVGLKTV